MLKEIILEFFLFNGLNLSFSMKTTLNFSVFFLLFKLTIFQIILIEPK